MTAIEERLAAALRDIGAFSQQVLAMPLRPYQLEVARAVVASVLGRCGHSFTVMMARQAGKNQVSAHLEAYLLTLFQRVGGQIVKTAPTLRPQLLTSRQRLERTLQNPLTAGRWRRDGNAIRLGEAAVLFLSGAPRANVVGATAHLLLEVDEAQDFDLEKYDKEFRPMGATTNVTTVLYGTPWREDDLLARERAANLAREAADGIKRHFEVPWPEVAAANPSYAAYVQSEIARLGVDHPLVSTQYLLRPLADAGGLFDAAQRAQIQGDHPRQRHPTPGRQYVAGIDVAGEDEASAGLPHGDAALRAARPRKDSTVVTIAEVEWDLVADLVLEPRLRVVEHYWWTGRGQRQQYEALLDLLRNVWRVERAVVDASGIGAGLAGFLAAALGRAVVEPFVFTAASKSRLAYGLLAAANGGRLKLYAPDGSPEWRELQREIEQARTTLGANRQLSFFVPPSQGHDDFLVSLALAVEAAATTTLRRAVGRRRPDR